MGASLSLDTPPGERAGALVLRALGVALADVVAEHRAELSEQALAGAQLDHLDAMIDGLELSISRDFLERPESLPLPERVAPLLAEWFETQGLSMRHEALTQRLRRYFVYSLIAEWRARPNDYEPLRKALDTPLSGAGRRVQDWRRYGAWLARQVEAPMFGEHFGLARVYVPLRGYFSPAQERDPRDVFEQRREEDKPKVVAMHQHVNAWLSARDPRDALRLLSGGPGSGKSSFARMLAAELAATRRVLLVPLFELDLKDDLASAVHAYLRRKSLFDDEVLAPDAIEEPLVLLFDGLDELSVRGALGREAAREFVRQVERLLRDRNHDDCRVQVLITGRDLAIQGADDELHAPHRILHLLPYYPNSSERERFDDPEGLLAHDQRDAWWAKYSALLGRDEQAAFPVELARPALVHLSAEPLLLYLLAFSYCAGKLDLSEASLDVSKVYDGLLRGVYQRGYEQRPHKAAMKSFEDFTAVLEEIGLAAWHGEGRTATLSTICHYCDQNPRLKRLFAQFEDDARAGVGSLLLAFYFRQRDAALDPTFEFTHLSFGEYLVARRLVRALERLCSKLEQGDEGSEDGWREQDALLSWAEFCGPTLMEPNLAELFSAAIHACPVETARAWQHVLCRCIGFVMRNGMPMEKLNPRPSFREEVQHANHAEIALFVALNACATKSRKLSKSDWPTPASFRAWLAQKTESSTGHPPFVLSRALSFLELPEANLQRANLQRANLQRANLRDANLRDANLRDANLQHANLRGADLRGANLRSANLRGANLRGSNLQHINLQHASLISADLRGADLRGANVRGANLRITNLRGADLTGSHYSKTSTQWPDGFAPVAAGCTLID
nr:pentapeptide repeat-containing protein [Haliangium ochraceum]